MAILVEVHSDLRALLVRRCFTAWHAGSMCFSLAALSKCGCQQRLACQRRIGSSCAAFYRHVPYTWFASIGV
jgi:hypothetical protein